MSGQLRFDNDATIPQMRLDPNGLVSGAAKLTISNRLTWNGGRMGGEGTTEVESQAFVYVTGGGSIYRRFFNNLGKIGYGSHMPIEVVSNLFQTQPGQAFYNPDEANNDFNAKAGTAWDQYLGQIEGLTGNVQNGAAGAFRDAETAANEAYVSGRVIDGVQFAGQDALANAYEMRVSHAGQVLATVLADPNATDDEIANAEAVHDDEVAAAAEEYAAAEQILYEAYRSSITSAALTFQTGIATARDAFSTALKNAGRSGAKIYTHTGQFKVVGDITTLVNYVFQRVNGTFAIQFQDDEGLGPPGQPISLAEEFASLWSAETRAAVVAAYPRLKGVELEIQIQGSTHLNAAQKTETQEALFFGRFEVRETSAVNREGFLARMARWGNEGQNFLSTLTWDGVVSATENMASAAWNATTTYVSNTLERAAADPIGFTKTVVAGYVETHLNVLTVAANTFTFGLVPQLNDRTNALIAQNGFYRVVQIGAVVGRELALTALTGGVGNVIARAGVSVAGALAVRMGVTAAAQARFICMATTANRLMQPVVAYRNLDSITANADEAFAAVRSGDYDRAASLLGRSASMMPNAISSFRETARFARATASLAAGNPQRIRDYLTNCFAAGTPVLGEFGSKPIEEFKAGDRVWARDESDVEGPARLQVIEETFQSVADIWRLDVGGRAILTTKEHPFWVVGRGWVELCELRPGDRIAGMSGEETPVRSVEPTDETLPVYNFRVADDHTYFIGSPAWGFSLWAHNTCVTVVYRNARNDPARPPGNEAHHLNQDAVFGIRTNPAGTFAPGASAIPRADGISVYMDATKHRAYHREMSAYWTKTRNDVAGGAQRPTVREYNEALINAMSKAGMSRADILGAAKAAIRQQRSFGFTNSSFIPRVPKR